MFFSPPKISDAEKKRRAELPKDVTEDAPVLYRIKSVLASQHTCRTLFKPLGTIFYRHSAASFVQLFDAFRHKPFADFNKALCATATRDKKSLIKDMLKDEVGKYAADTFYSLSVLAFENDGQLALNFGWMIDYFFI